MKYLQCLGRIGFMEINLIYNITKWSQEQINAFKKKLEEEWESDFEYIEAEYP